MLKLIFYEVKGETKVNPCFGRTPNVANGVRRK